MMSWAGIYGISIVQAAELRRTSAKAINGKAVTRRTVPWIAASLAVLAASVLLLLLFKQPSELPTHSERALLKYSQAPLGPPDEHAPQTFSLTFKADP